MFGIMFLKSYILESEQFGHQDAHCTFFITVMLIMTDTSRMLTLCQGLYKALYVQGLFSSKCSPV